MKKGRVEPLGVPGADRQQAGQDVRTSDRAAPNALDRWLVRQLRGTLEPSRVRVILWDEPEPAPTDGPPVVVRFCDRKALRHVILHPNLYFGDMYAAGRITVHGDMLTALSEGYRYTAKKPSLVERLLRGKRLPTPDLADSRRNIYHHYDLGNDFYELWLDREALQYTCAYFADPAMTIEQAQQAKMHHVCRKMRLKAGETVAEAGSGWGGFGIFMAKNYGAKVRSFNISKEQIAYAREWAKREQVEDNIEFVEDDFRNISGKYDAFVSIGMLEHAGAGNYRDLGNLIDRVLTPEGRGLIHTIGRDRPELLNAWIDRRIFPGAYPPTLREMMDIFEPNGLSVLDVENIRLHYAETLRAWLARFEDNVDAVRTMFDERFVRAWRLYLVGSIAAFLAGRLQLFQVLYARSGANDTPWTRAHIYERSD